MEPIFVYGTLKQGQPNYYHLESTENGHALFRSAATTINKYPLVISTKYNIPFLLHKEGVGHVSDKNILKKIVISITHFIIDGILGNKWRSI